MNYKKLLTEEILPKWIKISPDYEMGGVFTSFNKNNEPLTDSLKHTWFTGGRALWSYSMAHRICGERQEYLDICDHIFKFLKKITFADGRIPLKVDRAGNADSEPKLTYYNHMFAAMGCAQYYRVCGREDVKQQTEFYFDFMYDKYKAHRYTSQESNPDRHSKCFGLHMAMLAAMQFIRNAGIRTEKAEELIGIALDQIENSAFLDESLGGIHEHVALPGEQLNDYDTYSSCPGHVYEAAWFVLAEGEYKNDDKIRNLGKKLVDYALPRGFDDIMPIVPTMRDLRDSFEKSIADGNFLVWPQHEAIIAFSLAYKIFKDEKYKIIADKIENLVNSYFERFDGTIWYRDIFVENGDFVSSLDRGYHVNGPFHLERYLLAMGSLQDTGEILEYME